MSQKYRSFDPAAEVLGRSMLGFIQCARSEKVKPYLEKHDLLHIKDNQWYSLQSWLDVLSDLATARPGQSLFDFVSVGMKVTELTELSPEFHQLPFEQAVLALNTVYQSVHRGGDVGETSVERVGTNHIKIINRVPYPDDFMYGANYALANRFLVGIPFTVYYDEDQPRREQGGDVTITHIEWG